MFCDEETFLGGPVDAESFGHNLAVWVEVDGHCVLPNADAGHHARGAGQVGGVAWHGGQADPGPEDEQPVKAQLRVEVGDGEGDVLAGGGGDGPLAVLVVPVGVGIVGGLEGAWGSGQAAATVLHKHLANESKVF